MEYRDYIRKVTRIQRFYTKRYADKQAAATLVKKFIKGRKVFFKQQYRLKVKKATRLILERLEKEHLQKRVLLKWARFNFIQKKATHIQKAVRKHLAQQRRTMNRTRCVQFFWRKFARLLKYVRCV